MGLKLLILSTLFLFKWTYLASSYKYSEGTIDISSLTDSDFLLYLKTDYFISLIIV